MYSVVSVAFSYSILLLCYTVANSGLNKSWNPFWCYSSSQVSLIVLCTKVVLCVILTFLAYSATDSKQGYLLLILKLSSLLLKVAVCFSLHWITSACHSLSINELLIFTVNMIRSVEFNIRTLILILTLMSSFDYQKIVQFWYKYHHRSDVQKKDFPKSRKQNLFRYFLYKELNQLKEQQEY